MGSSCSVPGVMAPPRSGFDTGIDGGGCGKFSIVVGRAVADAAVGAVGAAEELLVPLVLVVSEAPHGSVESEVSTFFELSRPEKMASQSCCAFWGVCWMLLLATLLVLPNVLLVESEG